MKKNETKKATVKTTKKTIATKKTNLTKKGKTKKRVVRKPTILTLAKSRENPIISPRPENNWESWQVFNPGVILLDNKVYFIYRAIGEDGISRFGYAVSNDGFIIDERLSYPVYEHKIREQTFNIHSYFSGGSWGGAEDPRLVRIDDEDVLYMTYTACDNGLRVGLTSIKVGDFLNKKWQWKPPAIISPLNETHKNWLIFPEKIDGKYAILHSIKPNIQIEYVDSLEFDKNDYINSSRSGEPRKNCWDKWLRGAGAPPIKTEYGWLLLYHAMNDDWSKYKVGAMLLDINDPTKILHRSKDPVLEPSEFYENNGFKAGVVYASGAIIKDEKLLVYYGGADSYICVAYADLEEFLETLKKEKVPILKRKILKNRSHAN